MPSDDEHAPNASASAARLTTRERWAAGLLGIVGIGAGGTAVFVTTNQAGSSTLLLLGGVFALMAVQGTAVTKLGKEGGEFAGREAAIRAATTSSLDALHAGQPERAAAYMEVVQSLLAGHEPSPASDAYQLTHLLDRVAYERAVVDAIADELRAHMPHLSIAVPPDKDKAGYRAVVNDTQNPMQHVAIQVLEPDLSENKSYQLERLLYAMKHRKMPTMLVSSVRVKDGMFDGPEGANSVRVVHWTTKDDRTPLTEAVAELIKEPPRDPHKTNEPVVFNS